MAKLNYEERTGKLISVDIVKDDIFRTARAARDAMLAIPDRLAAEIAGMTDATAIHKKLMDEIRRAIANLQGGAE